MSPAGLLLFLSVAVLSADFPQDYNTAIYYYKRGEYELAARSFESLVERFPGDSRLASAIFWSAKSREKAGQGTQALKQYQLLIERFPGSPNRAAALFGAGEAAMSVRSYDQALTFFAGLMREDYHDTPSLLSARVRMAECRLLLGDDEAAEENLRDLITLPALAREQRHLAAVRLNLLIARAELAGVGRKSAPAGPRVPEWTQVEDILLRGRDAFDRQKFGESRRWFEEVVRRSGMPGDIRAHALYYGGRASLEVGDVDRARDWFEQVLRTPDALPDARGGASLYLAGVYRADGKTRAVEELAKTGEQIAESSGQSGLRDDMLYFRAESAYIRGRPDEAWDHLSRSPADDFRVRRLRGLIQIDRGEFDEGSADLDRAAQIAPDDDARNLCLADRARARFAQKNYPAVLEELGRMKNPSLLMQEKIRAIRADSMDRLGRHSDAADEYGRLAAGAAQSADPSAARRYRYLAAVSAFKARNESWASKLLSDLDASGGVTQSGVADPADLLNLAMQIDQAVSMTPAGKDARLKSRLSELFRDVRDTPLTVFTMDLLRAKNFPGVLPVYASAVLEFAPPSSDIYGRAATHQVWAYEKSADPAAAEESRRILEQWALLRPGSAISEDVQYRKAESALSAGDRPGALDAYRAYARDFPAGKYIRQASLDMGMLALELGRNDEAERSLSRAIELSATAPPGDPASARARRALGAIRAGQDRHAEAVELLEPLDGIEPYNSDPEYLSIFAGVLNSSGQSGKSEKIFRRIIDHPRASGRQVDAAIDGLFTVLYRAGKTAALESEFQKWSGRIRDPARASRSHFLLAGLLFNAGRYDEAAGHYEAVGGPPASPGAGDGRRAGTAESDMLIESRLKLAECDFRQKRFHQARERYARVLADFPESRWADDAHLGLGLSKIQMGNPEEALEGFEKFLRQKSNSSVSARMAIESARLYSRAEDMEAAERALDIFERLTPESGREESMLMRLGIYKKRSQHDKLVQVAGAFQKAYGFRTDVAVAAATSATKLQSAYDPFDLKPRKDIDEIVKTFEETLVGGRVAVKTFAINAKFDEGTGKRLGMESPLSCSIKRILIGESRIALVIEMKLGTAMNTAVATAVNRVTVSGEDVRTLAEGFVSGIQLGADLAIRYPKAKHFVISVPKNRWSDKSIIGLDVDVGGYKSQLFGRASGSREGE